jgi:hypothetical protein
MGDMALFAPSVGPMHQILQDFGGIEKAGRSPPFHKGSKSYFALRLFVGLAVFTRFEPDYSSASKFSSSESASNSVSKSSSD